MAAFEYQAVDSRGKNKKGVIEGDTARQVRGLLRDQGLMPTEVTATLANNKKTNDKKSLSAAFSQSGGGKVSTAELALITRQLATLIESGLPLEEALIAVGEQCEKNRIKSMIMGVRTKVTEGYGLSESMAEYPKVFNRLYRSMVAAGEKSGHLDKVLNRLADYTEKRQEMRSQLIQALVYPIIMTVVAVGVIAVLLTAVVPKIIGQFEHMGESLPGTTQFLIASSDFLRDYGLVVVILFAAVALLISQLLKKPRLEMAFHQYLLQVPGIGKVARGINTARFARTLSIFCLLYTSPSPRD